MNVITIFSSSNWDHVLVAQLVEYWVATREVGSSALAGPTLRVLK